MKSQVTIGIPIRIDTIQRKENLFAVIDQLHRGIGSKILLLEAANKSFFNDSDQLFFAAKNVDLIFIKDSSEIFHRTKYIDEILSMTTTEFVGIWDSDVIIPIGQIFKSIECLVSHESDFAFPFDGRFFDTGDELRKLYLENYVIDILIGNQNKMKLPYGIGSVGGAFLGKTTNYLCAGGENQNFYGWGVEDGERARRWEILGYKVKRIPGPLFHLTHPRGINSTFINESQKVNALKELLRITNMDTAELQCEILKWNKNV